MDTDEMTAANRANWDARTPVHVASEFYGVDRKDPLDWFAPFEWDDLGDLAGLDVAHLQCHLGVETMGLALKGARTTGLDFSPKAVAEATRIAGDHGLEIDYVCADVHDAVDVLGAERFDVVYTGKGALCYLPDLDRWAAVVAGLLRPGGFLYLAEFHPLLTAFGPAPDGTAELTLRHDYLEGRGALEKDSAHTYTDGPALAGHTTAYEWAHGLGEVVTALVRAGFSVDRLTETELVPWPRWPQMVLTECGWWALPEHAPRIPLLYGLKATVTSAR
ncbi:MAG TPA: class I SAM-dependent methyltransferase [Umezawaea sp.]|nr:class I SAM-dependent methyltransferase [Umezawaea sp.]